MTSEDRSALIEFMQKELGELKAEISKHRDQTREDSNGHYRALWKLKDDLKEDIDKLQDKLMTKIDNIKTDFDRETEKTNEKLVSTRIGLAKLTTLLLTSGVLGAGASEIIKKIF